jgi:glutamate-1-semialdehyde 2,1-aminomutase
MSATESIRHDELVARARQITARELQVYMQRTAGSQRATERARKVLPLGVPLELPGLRPPSRSWCAGRRVPGWRTSTATATSTTTWATAPSSPATATRHVREAVERQLDDGTLFVTPCELNADVAELLGERYGLPMWRFTNSGTEATMDAIRVARGITGREKLVKVEGGYHGHHDEVMISMKPPIERGRPRRQPHPIPATAGITRGRAAPTPSSSPTTIPKRSSACCAAARSRRSSSSR